MRKGFALAIILGFILSVFPSSGTLCWALAESSQSGIDQMLSVAERQHEIARLLIKEGRYERVLPEMRKILDLNLTGDYEQAVAKSSSFIAYLLAEHKQYAIAHQLLDETIAKMRLNEDIASLLKIKAYLYKAEGKLGIAIETLERSVDLEQQK